MAPFVLLASLVAQSSVSSDITLWSAGSNKKWKETNDPVMGGRSTGSFKILGNGNLQFTGEVVNVPKLKAPGFIKLETKQVGGFHWGRFHFGGTGGFDDISSCNAIVITARTGAPFNGYRLSFGTSHNYKCSFFSSGFKTHFELPPSTDFQKVQLPFHTFSNCNSDSTGEPSKTCVADSSVCPDKGTLRDVKTIGIWAEGAAGKVQLEVKSIAATGCTGSGVVVAKGRNLREGH